MGVAKNREAFPRISKIDPVMCEREKKTNAPELIVHENSNGRRVYETGGKRYLSVTSILSECYPKPELMGWGSRMDADEAVKERHRYEGMSDQEAWDYLQRAPYRYIQIRSRIGTEAHEQIDNILSPVVDGAKPVWWRSPRFPGYLDAARAFCRDHLSSVLAVECRVFSDKYFYAGTVDLMARLKSGETVIANWKTSKNIYPDNALQLAAYSGTDWMIDGSGTVRAMSFPMSAAVVRLAEDGKYEARFIKRKKLIEHHSTFVRLLDIRDFLGSENKARDKKAKGESLAKGWGR